jgi:hypothetical protein
LGTNVYAFGDKGKQDAAAAAGGFEIEAIEESEALSSPLSPSSVTGTADTTTSPPSASSSSSPMANKPKKALSLPSFMKKKSGEESDKAKQAKEDKKQRMPVPLSAPSSLLFSFALTLLIEYRHGLIASFGTLVHE